MTENPPTLPLTSAQCRRAREALGWTQERLAVGAGVSRSTISVVEHGDRFVNPKTRASIARCLRETGVEFLPDGAVRLRERQGGTG